MDSNYYTKNRHNYMLYRNAIFSDYVYSLITKIILNNFKGYNVAFELGAGMGRFSYALVKKFPTVYLVEPSISYASMLKEFFREENVRIFNMTAKEFFEKNLILEKSVCFAFHLLHHLADEQRKELFDFIKKTNSKAVFVEPNPWNPLVMLQIILHPHMKLGEEIEYIKLTEKRISNELKLCGLNKIQYSKLCFIPPLLTNLILHSSLKNLLPYFEKLNNLAPFLGSYQLIYCDNN